MTLAQRIKQGEKVPIIFLLLTNAIPLVGFLFWSWDLFSILFFYWLENLAIGMVNIPKILQAQGKDREGASFKKSTGLLNKVPRVFPSRSIKSAADLAVPKILLAFFFLMHYGLFTLVHGFFIFLLFGQNSPGIGLSTVALAGITMLISHFISYLYNFLGQQEYRKISPTQAMILPYKRIITVHLTVLAAGFLAVTASSAEFLVLLILILLKTGVDLAAHISEHTVTIKKMSDERSTTSEQA